MIYNCYLFWYECRIGGYPDDWIEGLTAKQYMRISSFFKVKNKREKAEMKKNK